MHGRLKISEKMQEITKLVNSSIYSTRALTFLSLNFQAVPKLYNVYYHMHEFLRVY